MALCATDGNVRCFDNEQKRNIAQKIQQWSGKLTWSVLADVQQDKKLTIIEAGGISAAVLTAIAIPVFTSQLEKSREAVDLSNVRAAYAEVMAAALTTDGTAKYTADTTQTIKQSDGTYKVVVQLKQQQDGWQTDSANLEVGGVKASDSTHWTGSPTKATHTCTITYTPAAADGSGESTVFAWA